MGVSFFQSFCAVQSRAKAITGAIQCEKRGRIPRRICVFLESEMAAERYCPVCRTASGAAQKKTRSELT
jgi:hypothetical protein